MSSPRPLNIKPIMRDSIAYITKRTQKMPGFRKLLRRLRRESVQKSANGPHALAVRLSVAVSIIARSGGVELSVAMRVDLEKASSSSEMSAECKGKSVLASPRKKSAGLQCAGHG